MILRVNILGIEVAKVDLEIEQEEPLAATIADKAIHSTTKWWLRRLVG